MLKKTLYFIIFYIIPIYLIGSFVAWDFNPINWYARGFMAILIGIGYLIVLVFHLSEEGYNQVLK